MPVFKKENSLIVYNSHIKRETNKLSKYFNSKLNINGDDSKKNLTPSSKEQKVICSENKRPKITLQKWSITSWLISQKSKEIVTKKSEETRANRESRTNDSGIEIQYECDHEYEASSSSSSDDLPITKCSNLIGYIKIKSIEWSKCSKELIDTHCHFDMLFNR
jgi:hypothetical protein